jgi:pimeloyl-ACP methyl ester carboxylesterase
VLHGLVQPLSPWLPLRLPAEVVEDFWRHSWASYSRTLRRVVVGHPAVPDVARLSMPCTLLYGAQDTTASRQPLGALLARNCTLRHVEVAGGHHLPVQDPRAVADVLGQVLATAAGRGPEPAG